MKKPKTKRGRADYSTLVYVGPTMTAAEAHRRLKKATILPPAAVGDILRAAHDKRVRRIVLIDGYFERMAAVWHKEILIALERGIDVWGAASMGALRAAELYELGMRGVGEIFEQYKSGHITADDEVAVAHLPAEYGYRPVSDALVNIRVTLRAFAGGDMISAESETQLFELARARFYRERTWAALFADARAAGISERDVLALENSTRKIDQKLKDARLLLREVARTPPTKPGKLRVPRTWALRQLERLVL